MSKLIDRFIEWALKDRRWPLLLFFGYFPLFQFIRQYFELSFQETFRHWCFLVLAGVLPVLAGLLYMAVAPPKARRHRFGGVLILGGALVMVLGLFQLSPQPLPDEKLVVAVASFTPVSPEAEAEAYNLTHRIERRLREKQAEGAPLKIIRLDERIRGSDVAEQRRAAIALTAGRAGKAHLIIWGVIRKDEGELYIQPHLTIARQLHGTRIRSERFNETLLQTISDAPTHLELKKRLATDLADIVVLVYGIAYYSIGDWDRSISILKHASSKEASMMLGVAYLANGLYKQSLPPLRKALGQTATDAQVYSNLAIAHLHLGQPTDAHFFLEKSLNLAPDHPVLLTNYGLVRLIQGEFRDAADKLRLALVYTDQPKTRSNLAFCLFEMGLSQAAIDQWKKSLAMLEQWNQSAPIPWDGLDAQAGLAAAYFAIGEKKAAVNLYRRVINLNAGYDDPEVLGTQFFWPNKIRSAATKLISQIK